MNLNSTAPDERGDAALLAAMARGDQAALGALYDRYAALAMGLANQIVRDRAVAEEVVQDAFVAAWRRAATYHPDRGEPRTWLLSIVRNRSVDRLRGAAARVRSEPLEVAGQAVGDADVWAAVWSGLERREIVAALAGLPPDQREAIELAFFGGLTHVEVAEKTGAPLGTVKGRMRLALRRLRTVLQDQVDVTTTGQTESRAHGG